MKIHLKSNYFKEAKFQCEDCAFVGQSNDTMEVYGRKTHTDTFWGLFEVNFGNEKYWKHISILVNSTDAKLLEIKQTSDVSELRG